MPEDFFFADTSLKALWKLKQRGDGRWEKKSDDTENYNGGSFSEIPPSRHQFEELAKLARNFIRNNPIESERLDENAKLLTDLEDGYAKFMNKTGLTESGLDFKPAQKVEVSNGALQAWLNKIKC